MVSRNQDFTVVRGDNVQQPFTVTLDQSRALDGTESWRFQMRALKEDSAALVSLTSDAGQITKNPNTFQPTVVFATATLPTSSFPPSSKDRKYWYDLEMTKDTLVETVSEGRVTVITDVSR